MFPRFRFTLSNTIAGSVVVSEPGGWDTAVLKLERNEDYHSLVEFYDQPMLFYGQDGRYNGGIEYIREIEKSQGPDAQVTILVEISEDDGTTYETMFSGLLDITSIKETDFYKLESGVIRNDFWQKFINRKSTDVDLSSTTDLDGSARTNPGSYTLNLPSQSIRQSYYAQQGTDVVYTAVPAGQYGVMSLDTISKDEIKERFDYPSTNSSTEPFETFIVALAGSYYIDAHIYANDGGTYPTSSSSITSVDVYIKLVQSGVTTRTAFTRATHGTNPTTGYTDFTYTNTVTLNVGDSITFYFKNTSGGPATFQWIKFFSNYIQIDADTTYTDTTCDAFYLIDSATSIVSKLVGQNSPITSTFLNSACGKYALTTGLLVRGYPIASKPFQMSFDDWWAGANPILNLGLGYTSISGTNYIEIEKKEDFYNPTTILNLDYVNKIERSYDTKYIFKNIEIGYQKWSAESDSGVDDPQTKRKYRTRFKTVGEDISILSKFYAASLGIEQTRRNRAEINKDWRLDNDIMIIALKSSDRTIPEKSENFTSVTGLTNYTTRYNIRISAGRIFRNWLKFFNGCLNWYTSNDDFYFASGEGNYDMTSTLSTTADCPGDGVSFSEKQDIDSGAGNSFMFIPIVYEFEHPLTWNEYKVMRTYRKNAIGVSRTNTGHVPCHILSVEYHVTEGKAKFKVLQGQTTGL